MSLGFTNIKLLQVLHVNIYSSMELRHLGIWSLHWKALDILMDDLKTTFNLMPLLQVQNISISCLFTWREIFPKNSKDTFISILGELSFSLFLFINNLSKTFLTHLSMKNNGKKFFCPTNFKNKISWWKLVQSEQILYKWCKVSVKAFLWSVGRWL